MLNTMLALPSVVVGLLVYLLLSRSGPLGFLGWLFSLKAMVVAQIQKNIDVMKVLSGTELDAVMCWLSSLPYPWCSPSQVLKSFPVHDDLLEIEAHLKLVQ